MVPVWRVRRVLPPRSGLIRQQQKRENILVEKINRKKQQHTAAMPDTEK
jgi:hypothetical protein